MLGLTALLSPQPIVVPPAVLPFDLTVMVATSVACLPIFINGQMIARWQGSLFLGYYAAYTIYLVLAATNHAALPTLRIALIFCTIPLTIIIFVAVVV